MRSEIEPWPPAPRTVEVDVQVPEATREDNNYQSLGKGWVDDSIVRLVMVRSLREEDHPQDLPTTGRQRESDN